jgi:hypothetical protein
MLSPIILFIYNREKHTRKTLEALKSNYLAKKSKLFIFADGAKTNGDIEKVQKTRKVIEEYKDAFLDTQIIKADRNKGLANSVISGVSKVIEEYGRAIVIEDDIVTSPYFLMYMNQALDYYEDNKKIWSISGYTPPMKSLQKYDKDIFLSYRACSWGWGTWKDRWEQIDWNISDYKEFKLDKKRVQLFARGGRDLPQMLESQRKGLIDSWAIRWCYWQSKSDTFTVYPRVSLVRNIGCDGSGTHDGDEDVFCNLAIEEEEKHYRLSEIELDRKITKEFYEIYSATLWFRIKKKIKKILKSKKRDS